MCHTDNVIKLIHKEHLAALVIALGVIGRVVYVYFYAGYIIFYEGLLLAIALVAVIAYLSWSRNQKKSLRDDLIEFYRAIKVSPEEVLQLESRIAKKDMDWTDGLTIQVGNFLIHGSNSTIRQCIVYLPSVNVVFVEKNKSFRKGRINTLRFTYSNDSQLQSLVLTFNSNKGHEREKWNQLLDAITLSNPAIIWR